MPEEKNEELEDIKSKITPNSIFEVDITSKILATNEIKKNNFLWTDKIGEKIVYDLFEIVKDELNWMTSFRHPRNLFEQISYVLIDRFGSSIKNKKNLEAEIVNEIENLKQFNFFVDMDYNTLDFHCISLEDIRNMFITLRKRKLKFYEALLKEYIKNKSQYDEKLEKEIKKYPQIT